MRSPRGKGKKTGALHEVHPQRILAQVLNALRDRHGFDTAEVDDVIMGCGAGSGDHSMDIARMAALDAGWDLDAPGVTLNRFCGSGQQAVNFAAMGVLSGHQDLVVAGGVESMSRPAPMHVDGFTANNPHLYEQYPMVAQGISRRPDRDRSRASAARSATGSPSTARTAPPRRSPRAASTAASCRSSHDDGTLALDHEEFPRPGTTLDDLAKLAPSFEAHGRATSPKATTLIARPDRAARPIPSWSEIDHVHHAGNSSGVVDGAGAVLVASPDYAEGARARRRGRASCMTAVAGTEPVIMLTAPGPAAEALPRRRPA